ncbi:hypothetical protein [Luteibacter sp.]|uniref:hypothetical protein n=1 Tax=Luteibacter sp. TaxID=1886636 RepID=UPI002F3F0E33
MSIFDFYSAARAAGSAMPEHPRESTHRKKAKPTPRTPVQRWAYPFALRDKHAPDTMHSHFQAIATIRHGFFPLSSNGYPNGSIHFGKPAKDALDFDDGFRCIADGEVIAYRLDSEYSVLDYGPEPDERVIEYSLGFVLVRHWLALPSATAAASPAPAQGEAKDGAPAEGIYLYSLYSYNRPLSHYRKVGKRLRQGTLPFWQGERVFRVSDRCTDAQERPPPPELKQSPASHDPWGQVLPPAPPFYDSGSLIVGRRIRAENNQKASILAILPHGAEFTVEGDHTSGWAQLRTIESSSPFPAVRGEVVPKEAERGWVWLGDMESGILPADEQLDRVVVLDTPYPVKAGERLGYLGENPGVPHAAPRKSTRLRDPAMALEVFAGEDFPAYLAQARERAAAVPEAQKTVLTIAADARLLLMPRPADLLLLTTQTLVADADSPPGPFKRGKRYTVVPRPVATATTKAATSSRTTGFRCSRDGLQRIDGASFKALPKDQQAKFPCEEVLEPIDDAIVWGHSHTPINRRCELWRNFPLDAQQGAPARIPTPMAIPRQELDALPADRKTTDPSGVRWWKIDISAQGGTLAVWVAEKGMPGVSWQSPQAWPGFQRCASRYLSPELCSLQLFSDTSCVRVNDSVSFGIQGHGTDGRPIPGRA